MKKALLIISVVVALAIIVIMKLGIQIGNVRIGSQDDLIKIEEDYNLERSSLNEDYLTSDKLICLNLWATWCAPCIAEMSMLNEFKSDNAEEHIEFLSLSVDKDTVKLREFLNSNKFDFTDVTFDNLKHRTAILNYLEDRPLDNRINSYSVPVTYLIKDGSVVRTLNGALDREELEKEVEALIN